MGSGRLGRNAETRSAESSPVESNGGKPLEMQLRLQSQQEELSRMQQEQAKLREELASQKVQISHCHYFSKCNRIKKNNRMHGHGLYENITLYTRL